MDQVDAAAAGVKRLGHSVEHVGGAVSAAPPATPRSSPGQAMQKDKGGWKRKWSPIAVEWQSKGEPRARVATCWNSDDAAAPSAGSGGLKCGHVPLDQGTNGPD